MSKEKNPMWTKKKQVVSCLKTSEGCDPMLPVEADDELNLKNVNLATHTERIVLGTTITRSFVTATCMCDYTFSNRIVAS